MKKNKTLSIIAKTYFFISKKINDGVEKWISKDVEKAKRVFFKTYRVVPHDQDIKEMKKEILMKKVLFSFVIVILLSIAFSLSILGDSR